MKRTLRSILIVLVSASVAKAADSTLSLQTFDAVWDTVRRSFYDPGLHGVDWEGVREVYRPQVEAADSDGEAREVIQSMLAELDASHTTLLDADVYRGMMAELMNRRRHTFGLLLEESLPGRWFVRSIYEGGPGERAGLRMGDRIVEIDGVSIDDSPYLVSAGYDPALLGPQLAFLRPDAGARLRLLVQTHPDADTRQYRWIEPELMNAVDAAENSVRVIERDGLRIGTLHIWFCSRGVSGVLRDAVEGPLADCDALVLDIRGRGGFSDVVGDVVEVFRGEQTAWQRFKGERDEPLWDKPLVVLIDDRSRSAKEILSYRIRLHRLGRLVGQRTEGAVLGAMFHPLPDGSYLELAGVAVPVNGVNLEGVGVAPHYEVDFVVPYARGTDPILEKGLGVAVEEVQREAKGLKAEGPF